MKLYRRDCDHDLNPKIHTTTADNMADIKALKDAVWLKKEAIKKEEAGMSEWNSQAGPQ